MTVPERALKVRPADIEDTTYIISLSSRVQEALTATGSLQKIGPLPRHVVQASIQGGHAYLLELNGRLIGSVLLDPLDREFPNAAEITYGEWILANISDGPFWYLHALMLEPIEQGKRLGKQFLEGMLRQMREDHRTGVIVLDCWAGNENLGRFYQECGFQYRGDFPEDDFEVSVYTIGL